MGSTGNRIRALEALKDQVVQESSVTVSEGRPLLSAQWENLETIATEIFEACKRQDLSGVAGATRKMKNKLRKRQFKKRLEALEAVDDTKGGSDKGKSGDGASGPCKCANCSTALEGVTDCIDDSLCSKCALEKGKDKDGGDGEKVARKALKGSGKQKPKPKARPRPEKKPEDDKDKDQKTESLRHRRY